MHLKKKVLFQKISYVKKWCQLSQIACLKNIFVKVGRLDTVYLCLKVIGILNQQCDIDIQIEKPIFIIFPLP